MVAFFFILFRTDTVQVGVLKRNYLGEIAKSCEKGKSKEDISTTGD
jgi:hypothetical protein